MIAFQCRKFVTACVQLGLALSYINTRLVAKAWLSNRDVILINRIKIAFNSGQILVVIM